MNDKKNFIVVKFFSFLGMWLQVFTIALLSVFSLPAHAALSCPSGFVSASGAGNAVAITRSGGSTFYLDKTLGPIVSEGTRVNNTNAGLLYTNSQLTLDLGEVVPGEGEVIVSVARHTANSRVAIAASLDDTDYASLGTFGANGTLGEGPLSVANYAKVTIPAGGARYIRFVWEVGIIWLDGVSYDSVCVGVGNIAGTVYRDDNGNNVHDTGAEADLQGISVSLRDAADGSLVARVDTDANGNYLFEGLAITRRYQVIVDTTDTDLPSGTAPGTPQVIDNVVVTLGNTTVNQSFGFDDIADQGTLSGIIYADENTNNSYDAVSELGLSSLTVLLYDDQGTAADSTDDVLVATTESAADGTYSFGNLHSTPTYRLQVDSTDSDLPRGSTIDTSTPMAGIVISGGSHLRDQNISIDPLVLTCPAGSEGVTGSGNATAIALDQGTFYETQALGTLLDPGTKLTGSNAALLTTNSRLTLDLGKVIPGGTEMTLSLGRYNAVGSVSITTSLDNVNFTLAGSFGGGGSLGDGVVGESNHVVLDNIPAGGIRYVRFVLTSGLVWVDGVSYLDMCLGGAFSCSGRSYLSQSSSESEATTLFVINTESESSGFVAIGTNAHGINYNGMGYNTLNNYLYAMESHSNNLVVIDNKGVASEVGPIVGLSKTGYYYSGAFDSSNHLYLLSGSYIYKVNVETLTSTRIRLGANIKVSDLVFSPLDGLIYAVEYGSGAFGPRGQVYQIDIDAPTASNVRKMGTPNKTNLLMGALYLDKNGQMFGTDNKGLGAFHFNLVTGKSTKILSVPGAEVNDGASCINEATEFGTFDFEDAPTSYGPAFHLASEGIYLGNTVTFEPGAFNSADADGDKDEGITIPLLSLGDSAVIVADVTGSGSYLQGWIDWNGDGDFLDSGEQIATNLRDGAALDLDATTGKIEFSVDVPATATLNKTFARFRFSKEAGLPATSMNSAADGEVEDYALAIGIHDNNYCVSPLGSTGLMALGNVPMSPVTGGDTYEYPDRVLPGYGTVDVSVAMTGGEHHADVIGAGERQADWTAYGLPASGSAIYLAPNGGGSATVTYNFDQPTGNIDLLLMDLDFDDSVSLSALDSSGQPITDFTGWAYRSGDLSVLQSPSSVDAARPAWDANAARLSSTDSGDGHRSFGVLTPDTLVMQIVLTFDVPNVTGRDIYTTLHTTAIGRDGEVNCPAGNITGVVYRDDDTNNSYNMGVEEGLSGITLSLVDEQSGFVVATTSTATDGTYTFTGVNTYFTYRIVVDEADADLPEGLAIGTLNPLGNIGVRENDTTANQNFGFDPAVCNTYDEYRNVCTGGRWSGQFDNQPRGCVPHRTAGAIIYDNTDAVDRSYTTQFTFKLNELTPNVNNTFSFIAYTSSRTNPKNMTGRMYIDGVLKYTRHTTTSARQNITINFVPTSDTATVRATFSVPGGAGTCKGLAYSNFDTNSRYGSTICETYDYGDAPSGYGSARHRINELFYLGATVPDDEGFAQHAVNGGVDGLGDDNSDQDDEDGITLSDLRLGAPASLTATVTGNGYLQGWIDWNNDGYFDNSEQIVTNLQDNDTGDANNLSGTVVVNFNVPETATTGETFARFRWSDEQSLNSNAATANGEVEDYIVNVQVVVQGDDYGDAPNDLSAIDADLANAYPTLTADNGAAHTLDGITFLGGAVNNEADGQPTFAADGDNDDGVSFPTLGTTNALLVNRSNEITVTASTAGFLNAWIDINQDGDWDDNGEHIYTNQALTAGANSLSYTPAATQPNGDTYLRFRFTSTAVMTPLPTGALSDGEVEDYRVAIVLPEPGVCSSGLLNGGFETEPSAYAVANDRLGIFSTADIYREYAVEGWTFLSTNPASGGNFDQRNGIELQRPGIRGEPYEGNYFAEINAYVFGAIYQDLSTQPGTVITYQFAHKGRSGDDTLDVLIGEPGATLSQTGGVGYTTGKTAWKVYSGTYTVPEGQYITRFSFEAIRTATGDSSTGNFIDDVQFGFLCNDDHSDTPIDGSVAPNGVDTTRYGEARHVVVNGMLLGSTNDKDIMVISSPNADGDGAEDDGVTIPTLAQGASATITATVSDLGGYLQGWMDWNGDGDFADAGEQVATNLQLANEASTGGTITIPVAVPADATTNQTFARFRWSTVAGLGATAAAADGEVEDYAFNVQTAVPFACTADLYQVIEHTLNKYNLTTGQYEPIGAPVDFHYSVGYRESDNLIYGIVSGAIGGTDSVGESVAVGDLVRVDATGTVRRIASTGTVSNNHDAADIHQERGTLWVRNGSNTTLSEVNASTGAILQTLSLAGGATINGEIVIVGDNAYRWLDGTLYRIELPASGGGTVTESGVAITGVTSLMSGAGAAFSFDDPDDPGTTVLYWPEAVTGDMYKITDINSANPIAVKVAETPVSGDIDGASCPSAVAPFQAFAIEGRVFEDLSYGGGFGRGFDASNGVGLENAVVEVYDDGGNYLTQAATTADGTYQLNGMPDGSYYLRVVSDTVNSSRGSADSSGELGVMTYRSDGITAVANEVGGHHPDLTDATINVGDSRLDTANFTFSSGSLLGQPVQVVQPVVVSGGFAQHVDLGFNFNTIVNTNGSGQGSLQQFVLNNNRLAHSGVLQQLPAAIAADYTLGDEVAVFMIPTSQLNGADQAVIDQGQTLRIEQTRIIIDGRMQSANIGSGSIVIKGDGSGLLNGLYFTEASDGSVLRDVTVSDFGGSGVVIDGTGITDTASVRVEQATIQNNGQYGVLLQNNTTHALLLANTILDNTWAGITSNANTNNTFSQNSINGNGQLGIDLEANGVTTNVNTDVWVNYPVVESGSSIGSNGTRVVTYDFDIELPSNTHGYRVEFFSNTAGDLDPSGHGEGLTYLGYEDITITGSGLRNYKGSFNANQTVPANANIATTVIEKTGAVSTALGATSEFSGIRNGGAAVCTDVLTDPDAALEDITIDENSNDVVYIEALDADGNPITYAISGGKDGGRFFIDTNAPGSLVDCLNISFVSDDDIITTRSLSVNRAGANLPPPGDYEAPVDSDRDNVYELTLTATDIHGNTVTKPLNVVVQDVNEQPRITSAAAINFAERQDSDVVVTDLSAYDQDAGDAEGSGLTYSLAGGVDAKYFTLDSYTGELRFIDEPDFERPLDRNTDNDYELTVRVADDQGYASTKQLVVTVDDDPDNNGVTLRVRALLQGAFDADTGLMSDALRTTGVLSVAQPYDREPFNHAGTERINLDLAASEDDNAIVDWVLLELRAANDSSQVVQSKALLIQRDGDLMDAQTGDTELHFLEAASGSYYLSLRHRNHLGVISAQALTLGTTVVTVDFSQLATPVKGEHARLVGGDGELALLWSGDITHDHRLVVRGEGNDINLILSQVLVDPGNTGFNSSYEVQGYHDTDLNMDGTVLFMGPGNDSNLLLGNILLNPANEGFVSNFVVEGGMR